MLAWRNYKRDRVDLRGANRVAFVLFGVYVVTWIPSAITCRLRRN